MLAGDRQSRPASKTNVGPYHSMYVPYLNQMGIHSLLVSTNLTNIVIRKPASKR